MKSASHTLSHREDKPKTFRVLLSITTEEDERLVAETFRAHHVPLIAEIRGKELHRRNFWIFWGSEALQEFLPSGAYRCSRFPSCSLP